MKLFDFESDANWIDKIGKYICNNKLCIDVGAAVGTWVNIFTKLTPKRNIIAFEPNNLFYTLLKLRYPDIEIHNTALSDAVGNDVLKVPFISGLPFITRSTLQRSNEEKELFSFHQKVTTTTLDIFCSKHNVYNIGFIKIDVEGHECAVLKGAHKVIAEQKPVLFIEIEQRHHSDPISSIFNTIKEYGYAGYFLSATQELLSLDKYDVNTMQNVKNIKSEKYINNFLFVPNNYEKCDS